MDDKELSRLHDLQKQLEVVNACRDFWYRCYTRASLHAAEQIHDAITEASRHSFKDSPECREALAKLEGRLKDVIVKLFVTAPVKSATLFPPPVLLHRDDTEVGEGVGPPAP
jgi:FMN phosphatase YigB (HAD superfamily)